MEGFLCYTDGSCWTGDRIGGYAWKAIDDYGREEVGGGSATDTTISRMEIMAVADCLRHLADTSGEGVILIYSDSEYVVKGFMDKLRKRNKNVDMWLYLEDQAARHRLVSLEHVKGHADSADNNEVDKLAGEFRLAAQGQNE